MDWTQTGTFPKATHGRWKKTGGMVNFRPWGKECLPETCGSPRRCTPQEPAPAQRGYAPDSARRAECAYWGSTRVPGAELPSPSQTCWHRQGTSVSVAGRRLRVLAQSVAAEAPAERQDVAQREVRRFALPGSGWVEEGEQKTRLGAGRVREGAGESFVDAAYSVEGFVAQETRWSL